MLIMHYFNDKPYFLMLNFAHYTLCQKQNSPNVKEEYVGTICVTNITDQTLTFLEGTKMLKSIAKLQCFTIKGTIVSNLLFTGISSNQIFCLLLDK